MKTVDENGWRHTTFVYARRRTWKTRAARAVCWVGGLSLEALKLIAAAAIVAVLVLVALVFIEVR